MQSYTDQGAKYVTKFLHCSDIESMRDLVNFTRINQLSDDAVYLLANGLANSGSVIKPQGSVYDIPSTGGPSSLSTLICPLILRGLGANVLKLGVSGRPAGGVDVLSQIKDYNISPPKDQLINLFKRSGYVHFIANKQFAPLDAELFEFRKLNNGIGISSLVIASLISKKIAVGLTNVGLDIRVSSFGNFGKNWEEARKNAFRFNKIAKMAGIKSKCFLTNGEVPQQPYIGRGEALLALYKIFYNNISGELEAHFIQCVDMALSVSGKKSINNASIIARDHFFENITSQGGLISSFFEIPKSIELEHKSFIHAKQSGYIRIDLKLLRDGIVKIQQKTSGLFPDPCGVILKTTPWTWQKKGYLICSYRCTQKHEREFAAYLDKAFNFENKTLIQPNIEIIENG